jgi:hypothetical protein
MYYHVKEEFVQLSLVFIVFIKICNSKVVNIVRYLKTGIVQHVLMIISKMFPKVNRVILGRVMERKNFVTLNCKYSIDFAINL